MKKITFLALHLGYGGIERCIINLANFFCETHEVHIVSTYKLNELPAFNIKSNVKIHYLLPNAKPNREKIKKSWSNRKIITFIKELSFAVKILFQRKRKMVSYLSKSKSDIYISSRNFHNKWLGKYADDSALKIAWEHNHHNYDRKYIKGIIASVKKMDYLIVPSYELYSFYEEKVNCKCIEIPNAISSFPPIMSNLKHKNLISVGRFSKEKGYESMLEVFKAVHLDHPDWILNIVGNGPEYARLKEKIKYLDLESFVVLHGFQDRKYINELLKTSSINLMTSYTEAFGIVIVEALAFGIPTVAFDSAQGACEIIVDKVNGYLIKKRDQLQMIKIIDQLIEDDKLRLKIGKQSFLDSKKYDINRISKKWAEIFRTID